MEEGRSELFELKLETDEDRSQNMFKLIIILNQIFGMLFFSEEFSKAFIGCLSDCLVHSAYQLKHDKNNVQPGLN